MTKKNDAENSTELTENTTTINRRSVVKALGAASGTAFVAASQASAVESELTRQERKERAKEAREAREKYSDIATVRSALREHTSEFIQGLYEEGFLSEPGFSQFKLNGFSTPEEVLDEGEGVTVNSLPTGNGGFKVDITLHTSTQNGEIEIHTVPKTGRTFAIENPRDKEQRTPIKQTADGPSTEEFCESSRECVATDACGCDGVQGCIHDKYDVDCCTDGCYYSKAYECCDSFACWSAICDCYC